MLFYKPSPLPHSYFFSYYRWERLVAQAAFACQIMKSLRTIFYPLAKAQWISSTKKRDTRRNIPQRLRLALIPWTKASTLKLPYPWKTATSTMSLWTDASLTGWGCLSSKGHQAQGLWTDLEKKMSINRLEILAILRAICHLQLRKENVQLYTDNETARICLNRMGSRTPQIHALISEVLSYADKHEITLSAVRISSQQNIVADNLSRSTIQPTEWEIAKATFQRIVNWHGPLEVDLMATPVNTKLSAFICPFPHPQAIGVDALTTDWNRFKEIYLFPPSNLLIKIIPILQNYEGHGVIITPWRPTAPWFPAILSRAKDHLHLRDCVFQTVQGIKQFSDYRTYGKWTAFSF